MEINALIVLGMHRSGTSLLAGLLSKVGVCMGKKLYAPQKGVNEKGFWEHSDIVDTHDKLLLSLNSRWDDLLPLNEQWQTLECVQPFFQKLKKFVERDFLSVPLWGLKDPRMCRLLPLWSAIFKEYNLQPAYICMNRNPFEVISSLQKRDHFTLEKGLVLWLNHSLSAEYYTRNEPRVFIDFNQVVKEPISVLKQVQTDLALNFPISLNEAKDNIDEFVSPRLRHHKQSNHNHERYAGLFSMADRLYSLLNKTTMKNEHSLKVVDDIRSEFLEYQKQWPVELIEHMGSLNRERAGYRIKFFQIYTSWTWKIVKPFWLIEKLLRKY